jgi:hypothetical protein
MNAGGGTGRPSESVSPLARRWSTEIRGEARFSPIPGLTRRAAESRRCLRKPGRRRPLRPPIDARRRRPRRRTIQMSPKHSPGRPTTRHPLRGKASARLAHDTRPNAVEAVPWCGSSSVGYSGGIMIRVPGVRAPPRAFAPPALAMRPVSLTMGCEIHLGVNVRFAAVTGSGGHRSMVRQTAMRTGFLGSEPSTGDLLTRSRASAGHAVRAWSASLGRLDCRPSRRPPSPAHWRPPSRGSRRFARRGRSRCRRPQFRRACD